MIGFHGIGNSHMFEDEEMGNYHRKLKTAIVMGIMKLE
mgnify:FL=1